MLRSFRSASKSRIGTLVIAFIGLLIVIGFGMGDIQNLSIGNTNLSSDTLAKAGGAQITDRDISNAMQRRLNQVRQQNPEATYAQIAGDFDLLLEELINQRALQAFASRHGMILSKRLVDAEIASIPGVKGLNGQFSQQSYQAFLAQQRLTDAEVRDYISGSLLQRLLVVPAVTNARIPVGVATPYASMLLEQREGAVALLPVEAFTAGLNPNDAQLQQYYTANRSRYMIPEQRVLKIARMGSAQVAGVAATDQEIEAYYKSRQDVYGAKDVRTIQQAVVQDEKAAQAIAQRARGGQDFVEAVKPAGLSAADVNVGAQTRSQLSDVAGDQVAAATFRAKAGDVVGPIRADLGWYVIKVQGAETRPGKSLAQAREEIAAAITAEKRNTAIADLVDKVQDAIDGGASFDEAARAANLQVTTTPRITASGSQRDNPSFQFPEELTPALKSGFELAPTDEPVIEQLPSDAGYALVAPAEVIPSAPAPLASIRDQVKGDWIQAQALQRAKAMAQRIASGAGGNTSLADAVSKSGASVPPVQPLRARRIQLAELGTNIPAPLRVLFANRQGKVEVGSDPQGRGYFVVKVDKVTPGNALTQPGLITQVQGEFSQPLAQEYAQQFMAAVRKDVGVKRNESAIAESRKRIISGGS